MKTPLRLLTHALVGVLGTYSAFAVTYYVKPTGSDSADGLSNATAWATIAKVNSSTFAPGDQILFRAGSVFRDATLVPPSSGSAVAPIVFGAYGTGVKPILTTAIVLPSTGWTAVGGDVYSRPLPTQTRMVTVNNAYMVRSLSVAALQDGQYFWDQATATLYVKDSAGSPNTSGKIYEAAQRDCVVLSAVGKKYILFSGLRFEKSNLNLARVVSFSHAHTFQDCEFYFGSSNGQFASAGVNADRCDDIRVERCRFSWLEGDGVYIQRGDNAVVIGNEIDRLFDFGGDNGPDGIQINGLKPQSILTNFVVKDNIVRREADNTAKGCIIVAYADGGIISGNSTYKGLFGIAFYSTNTVVEYNYCEGAGAGGGLRMWENLGQHDVTVRYNIVNGSTKDGLSVGHATTPPEAPAPPMPNIHVYNNVFYNTFYGVTYAVPSSGSFKNNVVWTGSSAPGRRFRFTALIDGQPFESNNNVIQDVPGTAKFADWMGTTTYSLDEYRVLSNQDIDSTAADPLFVNAAAGDFHLQASSPAIDAGAPYGPQLDYDGNPVPQGTPIPPTGPRTDIGAYEYGNTLAYEGFDYPVGALTFSGSGGIGWSDAWVVSGSAGVTEVLAGSHPWTDLPTSGNRFRIYDSDGTQQEFRRTLRKTFGSKNETYWLSFLVKKVSASRESKLELGGLVFRAVGGDWTVKTPSTNYATITGATYGSLHLIVARVDATPTGDTVRVWFDPVIAAGEPALASAVVTLTDPGFTFNTAAIKQGTFGNHLQSSEWDELRLGKTFQSVVSGP
jgi:hypothetical protein